jgi:hypothetical protein
MKYLEQFEDDGFVYHLSIEPSLTNDKHLYTFSQGKGFYCCWSIVEKSQSQQQSLAVTDDQCEVIIFSSLESAIKGAKDFLGL